MILNKKHFKMPQFRLSFRVIAKHQFFHKAVAPILQLMTIQHFFIVCFLFGFNIYYSEIL
jgi:hypothetical protein